ncbi:serine/threonine-protein kinase [Streptomyces triticirhizae]|uniref:non-specific serine/threonine protein kinase n=1 Tax=Streptomyces triticirhizae TaxID=2483353 RepID=A0A3M2LV70_9ACTN|nr:serine/threonine-protein kinase [Streptomyces triticirhizae]RMI39915.1 serine/threonine protein kinase [Streptomyces triticirhizae]
MRPVGSKYLLEEPLGRGATGTVWRGRQRETAGSEAAVQGEPGELVAIKVLKEELAHDPDVVMRFLRERSVLLRLAAANHTNIVRTRDLVVEGEVIALVMDLIDGPDLHRHLYENGPMTPVGAALLTAQIADALAAAHGKGIVHRDLKPANVLLAGGRDGQPLRPMLTDFGIARLADSPGVTRAHEFVGTPSYVAPESAEGREQTSAVDIYGAGILLYELVTGQPPFGGSNTLQVLQRHISERPHRPDGVPGPLWTVIERCLRKSADERPSASNLARALRTVAAGINEHATPEQRNAALGVGALLLPEASPVRVPGTGIGPEGSSEPTQVLPGGSRDASGEGRGDGGFGADPDAATNVLPTTGRDGEGEGGGRRDDGLNATRAMPTHGATPPEPEGPHPWEEQMRAARDRNEPTRVQPVQQPQDPLYRPPQRQPQRRPQQQHPQPPAPNQPRQDPYGYPPQQPQQQRYQPPPPPPQQYQRPVPPPYQEPPQRRQAEPRREREPRGRSRGANPMRIPGLGCLKGCLFMLLILVVIGFLIWNFTPLQDWIADGRSFWDTVTDWFDDLREMLGLIDEAQQTVDDNLPDGGE